MIAGRDVLGSLRVVVEDGGIHGATKGRGGKRMTGKMLPVAMQGSEDGSWLFS